MKLIRSSEKEGNSLKVTKLVNGVMDPLSNPKAVEFRKGGLLGVLREVTHGCYWVGVQKVGTPAVDNVEPLEDFEKRSNVARTVF